MEELKHEREDFNLYREEQQNRFKRAGCCISVEEAAVMNELEAMEKENIICGYHTLINWDKAGVEKVSALIEVRVTPQRGMGFDKVAERIIIIRK